MIHVNEPLLDGNEQTYVAEAISSGWISHAGKFLKRFEQDWAAYCGQQHGIAVSNGTAALQVAARALNLQQGDEVIMPTFTIISCALAIVECGATPVLVDADPHTWCMDVSQLEAKITLRTKAIMVVHIYGHPVEMQPVLELAKKYQLAIIEDAAEAHGAQCLVNDASGGKAWQRCGSFGTLSTFSFYANKIVTTGEGGMVLTSDDALAARSRELANMCFQSERRFYHTELSGNFRFTNLQAALGVAQIERIETILQRKRWLSKAYTQRLARLKGIQLPVEKPWARSVFWMYGLVLDESTGLDAATFAKELYALGIETRPFFLGMHEQPVFHQRSLFVGEHYPVAERIAKQGLYLPSGLAITAMQVEAVCAAVSQVLVKHAEVAA